MGAIAPQMYYNFSKTAIPAMISLSVNINKVATLRNARGGNVPDVCRVACDCERYGAMGITVHPRPDERHIRRADVPLLRRVVTTEFNIEGFPDERLLQLVAEVRPEQVTLVPDAPGVLTSSAGWDVRANEAFLAGVVRRIHDQAGARVSVFVDAVPDQVTAAAAVGADRVELYTGPYAAAYAASREAAVAPYVAAARAAQAAGLGLNAGHDLSLENLSFFASQVPGLQEVSIGHALICDALYLGLKATIAAYLKCLH